MDDLYLKFSEDLSQLPSPEIKVMFSHFGAQNINDLAHIIVNTYVINVNYARMPPLPPEIWSKIARNTELSQSDRLNLSLANKRIQKYVEPIIHEKSAEEYVQERKNLVGMEIFNELKKENPNNHKIQLLIRSNDANLNIQDSNSDTPLHFILWHDPSTEYIKLLLDHGADPNIQTSEGYTPLHLVTQNDLSTEYIKLLLDHGADPTIQNSNGWTPLHYIARYNPSTESIKLLLDHGADPNIQDSNGVTPLHLIARYNPSTECIKLLLDHDADPNIQLSDGWTPLHFIARYNPSTESIKLLLDHGADPNIQLSDGSTPLHFIAQYNPSTESIKLLLEHGVILTNKLSKTAITLYKEYLDSINETENPEIINLLSINKCTQEKNQKCEAQGKECNPATGRCRKIKK